MDLDKSKILVLIAFLFFCSGAVQEDEKDSRFVMFVTDAARVKLYWKDETGQLYRSIQNLKSKLESENQELRFAMNGGMYLKDNSPQGLFVEAGTVRKPLDTLSGAGNFYLKPNGVFYLTKSNEAVVCQSKDFASSDQIMYATQSGPMLVIDGQIHPAFRRGSVNLNIRNGVGILPGNKVVFAMSKKEINFYDFAEYFKTLGCKNALYLDGFVSRTYLPEENWSQFDGNFGVIVGVIK